jgi:hypothetical protein
VIDLRNSRIARISCVIKGLNIKRGKNIRKELVLMTNISSTANAHNW